MTELMQNKELVGLLILFGIAGWPLIFLSIWRSCRRKEKKQIESKVEGGVIYHLDGFDLCFEKHVNGVWFSYLIVGNQKSKTDCQGNTNLGDLFWNTLNHLEVSKQQSCFEIPSFD